MCTVEDEKAVTAAADNPQYLECLNISGSSNISDIKNVCLGAPFLPCISKCKHKVLDGKITPQCSQCLDQFDACGMANCDDCRGVGGALDSGVPCGLCMTLKCFKEAMTCAPIHPHMLGF